MFDVLNIWLAGISILIGLYICVWRKGPREGRLTKKIRVLGRDINFWRKRAKRGR